MKQTKTFEYCEYCNKAWEKISPPTAEAYKLGVIVIGEFSTILLSNKKGRTSFAIDLKGIYCNIDCLVKHLKKLREK